MSVLPSWYERCLHGAPQNWEMLRDVAMIEDAIWKAGPDAVLPEIAAIEEKYKDDGSNADIVQSERQRAGEGLRKQVTYLLNRAASTELNAVGLANQVDQLLANYCSETKANIVPEEFLPIVSIGRVLRSIGGELAKSRREAQSRDKTFDEMESLIAELKLRIEELEFELRDAKSKAPTSIAYATAIGALTGSVATVVLNVGSSMLAPEYVPLSDEDKGRIFLEYLESREIDVSELLSKTPE